MSNEHIARAITYAVRQATLINQYGMTWEAIEANTANILAGCSVPADGKMNSAEAVSNHVYDMLKRGLVSPDEARRKLEDPHSRRAELEARIAQVDRLMGERDAQNQRANQAEKDNADLEARNVELRLMLERSQEDRDGFRKGVQYWYDEATKARQECHVQAQERNAAEAKVVKLRTVLQNAISDPFNASLNTINHVLDETK